MNELRTLLLAVLVAAAAYQLSNLPQPLQAASAERPNIILIMADDMR